MDGSSNEDRERLLARFDGRVIERKAEFWKFRVNDPGEDAPLLLANELSNESIVKYAEPNALQAATFQQLPQNEPNFGNQWTLQNTGQNGGTVGADVNALGAWAITTGSPNISIVVHDSGVDINHPDLNANIGPGWDFDNNDNDATNNNGPHGTACAGIIAAAVNGQGVVGIASNCRIIPLRAAGAHTWQEWADIFDWAAQQGRIISCSWTITPNNTLSAAIRNAVNNGVTVFCAAGNNGTNTISYPASMAETIAVGASTNQDVRANYSQFGNGLDIVAPSSGGTLRVETTDVQGTNGYNTGNAPAGDYCNANDGTGFGGTSAATPLAAGVAGLMLSVNPSLTPADIRAILQSTADRIDQANGNYDANGLSPQYGHGRVNAPAAVGHARQLMFILQTGTALHETDQTFDFAVADWDGDGRPDLIAIKKSGTGSHSTEVHILSGASNFQQFILQTGTALHETDQTFDFAVADWDGDGQPDLIAIKKSGTGSHSTEAHILSGASNFQQFILQTGTALHETDQTFDFAVADWDGDGRPDLIAIKKSGTGTNSTEVHVVSLPH